MHNCSLVTFAFQDTTAETAVAAVGTVERTPPGEHSQDSTPDKISNEHRQTHSEGVSRPAIRNSLHDNRAGCAGNDGRPRRRIHRRRREILGALGDWKKRSLMNPPSSALADRRKKIVLVYGVVTVWKRKIPLICPVVALIQKHKDQEKMPP